MKRLDFGDAFSKVFDLFGQFAAPLLVWSAAVSVVSAVISTVIAEVASSSSLAVTVVVAVIGVVIAIIASSILTAAYMDGLPEAERTGTFPAFGDVWPRIRERLAPLIGTTLLMGLIIAVAATVLFVVLATFLPPALAGLLAVLPSVVLLAWWLCVPPVVVLEGSAGPDALGRSKSLVDGNTGTVVGLIIVIGIVIGVASSIAQVVLNAILGALGDVVSTFLIDAIVGTFTTPFFALLTIVVYEALVGSGDDTPAVQDPPPHSPIT
jgi:hypothetical protein